MDRESAILEYKKGSRDVSKDFWKTYSAFSNTKGGKVVFEIDEKKKYQYEVVGVKDEDILVTNILNGMNDSDKVSYSTLTEDDMF